VEVRFSPGTGLYIGKYYSGSVNYWGALKAQGTAEAPIVFTSNASSPAPGDWKGIYFTDYIDDATAFLEHGVIEYGGLTHDANVYVFNAKPAIQYNTIRNSRHSGIVVNGLGSDGVAIHCNNFRDNLYGVYALGSVQPSLQGNNFLHNINHGVYNASGTLILAENNWWGDASGANATGDKIYGNVDFAPWLTAESACISSPPTNSPPFAPKNPSPVNNAVRVVMTGDAVALSWHGGDPNPWDTVVYDVAFGTAANALIPAGQASDGPTLTVAGLLPGTTYYWQVTSRDNGRLESVGPVWRFTTPGSPPDLAVSQITWTPETDIAAGQIVTFTTTILNEGIGPVVDAFLVDFRVDGVTIGTQTYNQVLAPGQSFTMNWAWTAKTGDHTINVIVDSTGKVVESEENENSRSQELQGISDRTPPELSSTQPANGAEVQQIDRIVIVLLDRHGSVDDAAMTSGNITVNRNGSPVSGTIAESSDRFTFIPATLPFEDGFYQVAIVARDLAGNAAAYNLAFTLDSTPPDPPAITGGTVHTGTIRPRPFENGSKSASVTLTGARSEKATVWINGTMRVAMGTGDLSVSLALAQGANSLEIWLQDGAGNRSASTWVDIKVDSVAPAVTTILPADNAFLKSAPQSITLAYEEATSGLNSARTVFSVRDVNNQAVAGAWSLSGDGRLVFAPSAALLDGSYGVDVQLEDNFGNRSTAARYRFTLDTTLPPVPKIAELPPATHSAAQVVSGVKEAYARIFLNGVDVVGPTPDTTWQYTVTLAGGTNTLVFVAMDRAGNQSPALTVTIVYDDIAPPVVSTLKANGNGIGTTVSLDWTGYNQSSHGDIACYRIYVQPAPFTDVTGLTPAATVPAGAFSYKTTGLAKGATYWFAVVAEDVMGNAQTAVNPVSAVPKDAVAPEEAAGLLVTCYENRLVFSWMAPADTHGDFAGYKIYFDGDLEGVVLAADATTFEATELSPATGYPFEITTHDRDGNESAGVAATGITLLPNPTGLTARGENGYAELAWNAVSPSRHVKHYAVYMSASAFASVEGMTPKLTTTSPAAKVAGLTNNTAYYFAVTAVSLSGCERTAANAVAAMPAPDSQGPGVGTITIGSAPLTTGYTLTGATTISITASDPSGMSRVEFYVDGTLMATDYSGPSYDFSWNPAALADGSHGLTVRVYDSLGNFTTRDFTIHLALAKPPAPTITWPASGTVTGKSGITVSGTADKNAQVVILLDGADAAGPAEVTSPGLFAVPVNLKPGANTVRAVAQNRAGRGDASSAVTVTLDLTIPPSPAGLTAEARANGVVKLSWRAPDFATIKGYNVYRANASFTDKTQAAKVNGSAPVALTSFEDLPSSDGTYYYRVTTVSAADSESAVSDEAAVSSDRTPPRLISVIYTPRGKHHLPSGRFGQGRVDLLLTLSEPLQGTPFFSLTPEGGLPIPVELTRLSSTEYAGFFMIEASTPAGTANAVFSARDLAGNRGTQIDRGQSLLIDTAGPAVTSLTIQPPEPIRNEAATGVTVRIGTSDRMKPGEEPQLSYLLSAPGRTAAAISGLNEVGARTGEAQAWQATFALPADAGGSAPESLSFVYQGIDDLDNIEARILSRNTFQVYQGALPPLSAPEGLAAASLPAGRIRLAWQPVEGAAGYQLFRKAPGQDALSLYGAALAAAEFADAPTEEGAYAYAVASIREGNAETSLSGMSNVVTARSDATPPGPPASLTLTHVPQGILAEWQAAPYTEPVTYSIYRAAGLEITSVEGLTPLAKGIGQLFAIDPKPSLTEHCYVVTAVDAAGNVSRPSSSEYLNIKLLPVSSLKVVQQDTGPPVVSWTHPGGDIAGYDIYVGAGDSRVKLNNELLKGFSFTDTGYDGGARTYTLVVQDLQGEKSLERSILLPEIEAGPRSEALLRRGIMNRLELAAENRAGEAYDHLRLNLKVGNRDHISSPFSLQGRSTRLVPVVVGGYQDLPDYAPVVATIEYSPNEGERAEIIRSAGLEVGEGMLVLQIENEELVRGGSGKVRFSLENTGEEEIEITLARQSGQSVSNEVAFHLMDPDENVLATLNFKQSLGPGVVTLANGNSVARIPAGAVFTSESVNLPVPANAPDDVLVHVGISSIYHHQGRPEEVKMTGRSATHAVSLQDTSYYGEVGSITPQSSVGDRDIVIAGRAVDRATGQSLSGVPLNLVISVGGFERSNRIFTDAAGGYTYTFKPLPGEAGLYKVRAVHPDLLDRPVQGQFVISRVSVNPAAVNLSLPRNYEQTVNIQTSASEGAEVRNLRLVYAAEDQSEGILPQGIHLTPGAPIALLGSKQTAKLPFTLWADNTADAAETIVLKVVSDEAGPGGWAGVVIKASCSQALPVLAFTPDHVETGVSFGATEIERITLSNRGLAEMRDVQLALVMPDGSAAPPWVYLATSAQLGSLAVGEGREVSVAFSPTTSAASEGTHYFKLRVTSSNHAQRDINLYAAVTQSGRGHVLFKVSDIYTGTLDRNNALIQGLSGARVTVQNELVLTEEYDASTDGVGEAYFSNLPAGRYKCRVSANNHQEYIGRLWVKPGITVNEEVFLEYNLVSVDWKVTEITIQDKYDILLTATYETNVPAAVVVAEPASISLPAMQPGDVYNGEFTLTNHGLIRADNIAISLPGDDAHFRYEVLGGLPQSIEAKGRITVPYRVVSLQSLSGADGQATGGGCQRYQKCMGVTYGYRCANGKESSGATKHCVFYDNGDCSVSSAPISSGGVPWTISVGTGGGGSYSSPAPAPAPIRGVRCFPDPGTFWKEEFFSLLRGAAARVKDTLIKIVHMVGCSVNSLTREYQDAATDMVVKVPGGVVAVERTFYGNQWHWEHTRNNLSFANDSFSGSVSSISRAGIPYKRLSSVPAIYVHGTFRIIEAAGGYRWTDTHGNWQEYDSRGRLAAYGTLAGAVGKLVYEEGANGRVNALADRDGNDVIRFAYDGQGNLARFSDGVGRTVEYGYASGRLTTVKDVLGQETTYEYDAKGRIVKSVDSGGHPTTVAYDGYGGVASVVDRFGNGHFFEYDYDEARKESYARITTSAGRIEEVWYDRDGETRRVDVNGRTLFKLAKEGRNLIVTDEKGNITRKDYDEWDNLTRVIHVDGSHVSFEYDLRFNKVKKVTDLNGSAAVFEYDERGNLLRKVEAEGTEAERITAFTYSSYGQILTATVLADQSTEAAVSRFTYDLRGNLATMTDPEGHTTEFLKYDPMGNLLEMKDPRANIWKFDYDQMGRLVSQTDPLENKTSYEYDGANNRTAVIDAVLKRFDFEYDDHNNLIKATDPYANYVAVSYTSDSLPARLVDQEGRQSISEYDNEGRLRKTVDGAGNQVLYHYDETQASFASSGKPVQIDYPTYTRRLYYDTLQRLVTKTEILDASTSHTVSYEYDAGGNVIAETDEARRRTVYEYDGLNRLIRVTDPMNGVTERAYDDRGNLIRVKDPNNGITAYEYDRNNRLKKVTRPMLQATSYEYDASGNRTAVIDAKGQRIEFGYNAVNRLTRVRYYAAGDHATPVKAVDFAYDQLGNLVAYDDGATSASYAYDDLQRKISETVNYGPFSKTIAYSYYGNGLKKSFTDPGGTTCEYAYDENNRMAGVTIPGQGQISFNAYQWNSLTRITLPGGSATEYAYDPLMRVKTILAKDPAQNPIVTRQYQHSPAGHLVSKGTEHGDYSYQYDALSRLTRADNPTQVGETYAYDLLGNRTAASGIPGEWAYNANNELLSYGSKAFTHDGSGNLTRRTEAGQETNYIYDVEDRLVRVENGSGGVIARYYYDPFGRRLWKQIDGVRTNFVYSDEGLIGEVDASGTELKTYGWSPHSPWGTDPLFVRIGSQYYWYQNDHQGTPQKIITTSGLVVWSATYDSFGNARIGAQGITSNLRFPGQYHDAETGLHYNLHRHFDPETARYLSTDPYGQGLNHYAYSLNNPLTLIDPLGLCAVNTLGRYAGTGFGAEATTWYAEQFNATGNPIYFVGGSFSALWTPETYLQTALALAAAPYAAAEIAAAGVHSVAAAARMAAKQVVKEVIGVPVPAKPKHATEGASSFARSLQGKGSYSGVDRFRDITLKEGRVIFGGAPGQSNFYTTASGLRRAGGSSENLFSGLQVAPHPVFGYRPGVTAYQVLTDTPAAFGLTIANSHLGRGGLPQIVIQNYQDVLRPLYSVPLQ
jgi:RHS repeat-associated protein